ncbi:Rieske 2Fe-2S domain-containing protein [Sulfitobacter pseudonitzschiae]|uniref:p-cumate 2,3-dioxygenase alpha subunit n=2 Tax=Roseobacteraceae TaxID=2854170 RepID=A0A975WDX5_9RHOB|nr:MULTISPECIES: aromatic ring-hydroxylating dioxygenase subunit alpha [Roseobacteraceae]MBB06072.1 p-cumate dioxygenase [Pseudooceanicola sp.]MBM1817658.1 Rieske 2Fe-2S domain-containing protein [Pseudosulfitobacter pseudonitzschiae]MBM1834653.1 Rieske 2Fe-2S domain-containing protein [Pseudosulfitobacter pseudonitzschiae]MBM1839517.1 Rieske 2Fe-2S domain-containing protein [Pseudosulfitobacter pseudonitzschiae]MBM1844368.1 Rieske 2Fe-2S domain-containing protein [Pseudosulfitobacter pseudoni|tara:strand:+ start:11159 stop:12445 length:1287 start_codon:yes stop_codon:yes gene_type:complete
MNPNSNDPLVMIDNERHLFKVSRSNFTDPEVFAKERERIFSTCWLYLGHESELKKPGDFVTRVVGGRSIVFNKDRQGEMRALFNSCPHRGAQVCRERKGNAKAFQCFYHGWVFGQDGALRSQPGEDSYAQGFKDDPDSNMRQVPRLESYRGLYFICYDPQAVTLEEYLGNAKEYLDLVCDQAVDGMEVIGGTQEYAMNANWKLLVENSIDGYHAVSTHATYLDYLKSMEGGLTDVGLKGVGKDLGNGHGVIEYTAPWGRPAGQWISLWGEEGKNEIDALNARNEKLYGKEKADRIAYKNRNLLIFPNLIINDIMSLTIRTFFPQSPSLLHVNAWAAGPREESEAARQFRLSNFLEFLGPGGFATPDDVEALEQCQLGYRNSQEARWNDISKGMKLDEPSMDDEAQMRAFWREWDRRLTGSEQAQGVGA